MNNFQVLKDQAAFIDEELINLTYTTNSFFETEAPITELENYLANLKKFDGEVQVELELQRKNLQQSKNQVKDVTETLNKLDDLISSFDNDNRNSSNLNLSERLSSSARLEILEKENDDSVEDNSNERVNSFESVDVDDLLNKPLPQL